MTDHPTTIAERLHRLAKLALDTGEAADEAEALAVFGRYRVQLVWGTDVANSPVLQAAILTAANTAVRCLLGGVTYQGPSIRLCAPWRGHDIQPTSLGDALEALGAHAATVLNPAIPTIAFGNACPDVRLVVQATFDGWNGGVVPLESGRRLPESGNCTPAGVLAGAMAVSEVFLALRKAHPLAANREVGMSLWQPGQHWRKAEPGPSLTRLPESVWMIGLGNLGQAYLWTLGLLPYTDRCAHLVLQDFDRIAESNRSTSALTQASHLGAFKTRAMAKWAEQRGFSTSLVERQFAADFKIRSTEPRVALVGLDNVPARRELEEVGFARVIETGLGAGPEDFLGISLHTFPASRPARECWLDSEESMTSRVMDQRAYRQLKQDTGDACGTVRLAGRSIGAPFVGAVAGALGIAEFLRLLEGAPRTEFASVHLRDPAAMSAIAGDPWPLFNPGIVPVAGP